MKTKKNVSFFGMCLLIVSLAFTTSCDKSDDVQDPTDTVTLNMLDEDNGKTYLGASSVYINKANNFFSSSSLIADCGSSFGIGANVEPKLDNLVYEAAVVPGHLYQIFDKDAMVEFPSGVRAIQVGAAYYKVYTVSRIKTDDKYTGAMIKYVSEYPEAKELPEVGLDLGNQYGAIEIDLPKGAEYYVDDKGYDGAFDVSVVDGKLVVCTTGNSHGYGTHYIYLRLGSFYSFVTFEVE